mmetsp:Transcript_2000/g.5714  ORF Transcript_2000/g.5714 Transcript_2000/m.5714 type:complete len:236 (+) Transcript_2000:346-1053(+)
MNVAMPQTPSGAAADIYRFYCPLCMLYFKSIHRMSCCLHHVCCFCLAEYTSRQSIDVPAVNDSVQSSMLRQGLPCPCCGVSREGITIEKVAPGEQPRVYGDSPRTKAMLPAITESMFSPVKIGDNFEVIRRKMITFEAAGYLAHGTPSGSAGAATLRGEVRPEPLQMAVISGHGSPALQESTSSEGTWGAPAPESHFPLNKGRVAAVASLGAREAGPRAALHVAMHDDGMRWSRE